VTDLEFRVLGPVEVMRGGHRVALGGRTTLTLLAALAVSPCRVISVDTLIDYVWNTQLPDHPRAALHNGVSRLRRLLGEDILETLGWGYRLRVDAPGLDLLQFDQHLAAARQAIAAGRDEAALTALDDAIRLWQEPLLGNVDSPSLHREVVPQLTERYLGAVESRAELCLRRGVRGALVEELAAVARAHPLRERITGQLMIALVQAGRRADALVAYNSLKRTLRDELGIDPTDALKDLHVKILRADPDLGTADPPRPRPASFAPQAPRPADRPSRLPSIRLPSTGAGRSVAAAGELVAQRGYGVCPIPAHRRAQDELP
jgi:DNA-binding SARP family transcriptional activator